MMKKFFILSVLSFFIFNHKSAQAQSLSPSNLADAILETISQSYESLENAKANLTLIKATIIVYKKTKNKVEKEYLLSNCQSYLEKIYKRTPKVFKPYVLDLKNKVNKLRYYNRFNQPQNALKLINQLSEQINDLYYYLSWV